jgi:hypothetical protein
MSGFPGWSALPAYRRLKHVVLLRTIPGLYQYVWRQKSAISAEREMSDYSVVFGRRLIAQAEVNRQANSGQGSRSAS